MKRFNSDLYYIDVKDNEKEVLEYLHSLDFEERGQILSPKKDVWFEFSHYIKFLNYGSYAAEKRGLWYWYQYTYCTKKQTYEGKPLELITLDQLKEMTAYLKDVPIKKQWKKKKPTLAKTKSGLNSTN
jgi:hypothetical protein